ncbi:MAG: cytochrome c3 family protein [Nitrospirota bacterium]
MDASLGDVFRYKTGKTLILAILLILIFIYNPISVSAKVTGQCANCHTMHNSQDGGALFRDGTGIGWDSGQLQGGSLSTTPAQKLLVTSCVGCHSNAEDDSTIVAVGGSNIPIVYNTGGYPSGSGASNTPLAGGNFWYVAQTDDSNCAPEDCDAYGHNVFGISGQDQDLLTAPGTVDACGVGECHATLSTSDNSRHKPGCQACHQRLFHHVDSNETSSNTSYRFLWGHAVDGGLNPVAWVEGVEDDDWEQETVSDHNYYKGTTATYSSGGAGLSNNHTMSAFCSGCHAHFHGPWQVINSNDGMGSGSPWLRHPTDIALPETGEYSAYDPVSSYSTEAPVAWVDPVNPTDRAQAIVMCLSCHRPHGSDQPDMLRWDYDNMVAGGGTNTTGCFTCHTTKDDGS